MGRGGTDPGSDAGLMLAQILVGVLLAIAAPCFFVSSAAGIYSYGWINLGDELLCGLLVLVAFFLGSFAQNGSVFNGALGATKRGGGVAPVLSGRFIVIFAPCALGAGLLIGAMFPPWSVQESAAMAVASACALRVGYMVSKS